MKLPLKFMERAKAYLKDPKKLSDLLSKAKIKQGMAGEKVSKVKSELQTLVALTKAWLSGEYRKIPWSSMLRVVGALLYFVWVIDLIPDPLLGIGFIDDIGVIFWTVKGLRQELEDFREWQASKET